MWFFGTGNPQASLVFVGEAPGADEDQQGLPFVGRAGQLLTKIIEAMGFRREDVYIANILKCRPPNNRNPLPAEIRVCEPFLIQQLMAISPKVICALGTFAAQTLLKREIPITVMRG
jgi:DNA polymerase